MDFPNLTIIGERINPGFKSSLPLFETSDIDGICALAQEQVAKGAACLNLNIGTRALSDPEFMRAVVTAVQQVVAVPLSFDFPNVSVQELCLEVYDQDRAGGGLPIINSISELRWEMVELLRIRPCRILLMASERNGGDGLKVANRTANEVYATTVRMVDRLMSADLGLSIDNLIVDVSVGPVAADMEGLTKMAVESIRMIGSDPQLRGLHLSVGLSNISIMVPPRTADGRPLKLLLESAFLTNTVPYGLDHIIGTAGRHYRLLAADDPVMRGFNEALERGDIEAVMRIQELYQPPVG